MNVKKRSVEISGAIAAVGVALAFLTGAGNAAAEPSQDPSHSGQQASSTDNDGTPRPGTAGEPFHGVRKSQEAAPSHSADQQVSHDDHSPGGLTADTVTGAQTTSTVALKWLPHRDRNDGSSATEEPHTSEPDGTTPIPAVAVEKIPTPVTDLVFSSSATPSSKPQPQVPPVHPIRTGMTFILNAIHAMINPAATNDQNPLPAQSPLSWTMLAAIRGEIRTPSSLSEASRTAVTPATSVAPPTTAATVDAGATQDQGAFTGTPSLITSIVTFVAQAASSVSNLLGVDLVTPLVPLISSDNPPWFTTLGLKVEKTEFEGMPVWTIQSPTPSDRTVVAVHGGAYTAQPNVLNWFNYASLARDTGAIVVVTIYPLAPRGTAAAVVPVIADLFSDQVARNGADDVSVYGDSAGGGLALAAMQEVVRRGDPTPASMVLLSPWLDVTVADPRQADIKDPILNRSTLQKAGLEWAGSLDPSDPLVSPINGSLTGLPPTFVYSGSLDILSVDTLRLRDKAISEDADFDFVLRKNLLHDWPILPLPEGFAVQKQVFGELV
jgi:triacylglycerol lipase